MKHRRKHRVRRPMAGDVDDRDSGFPLAALQVLDDVEPAFMDVVLDSRLEVEALLEIEKDQEVAAHRAVEGERASINVHSANQGKIPGLRNQITGNLLEIFQLARELTNRVHEIRMHARSAVSKEVRAVRAAPSNASVSDANCWFSAWLSAMAGPPAKGSDVMQKILESLHERHAGCLRGYITWPSGGICAALRRFPSRDAAVIAAPHASSIFLGRDSVHNVWEPS